MIRITLLRSDNRFIIPTANRTNPIPDNMKIPLCNTVHAGFANPVTSENKSGKARPHGSNTPHKISPVPK